MGNGGRKNPEISIKLTDFHVYFNIVEQKCGSIQILSKGIIFYSPQDGSASNASNRSAVKFPGASPCPSKHGAWWPG